MVFHYFSFRHLTAIAREDANVYLDNSHQIPKKQNPIPSDFRE